MNYLVKRLTTALLTVVLVSATTLAQEQAVEQPSRSGQIHIELKSDANGESKSFSKDYDSREEMQADTELMEFLGEQDIQFHFFSGEEARAHGFTFGFEGMDKNSVHVFSDIDSMMSVKMNERGLFHFRGLDGSDEYVFRMHDAGEENGVWSFNASDSVELRQLTIFDVDSLREAWQQEVGDRSGAGVTMEWESGEKGMRQMHLAVKKVTISKLEEAEASLDKLASKRTSALEPVSISYYPNPSSGRFTIEMKLDNSDPLQVSIVDLSGGVVHEEEVRTFDGSYSREFDLSAKPAGIYLLQMVQGGRRLVRKIIIN